MSGAPGRRGVEELRVSPLPPRFARCPVEMTAFWVGAAQAWILGRVDMSNGGYSLGGGVGFVAG